MTHTKNKVDEYQHIDADFHHGRTEDIGHLYKPFEECNEQEYLDNLVTHMNTRVLLDHERAVGGTWQPEYTIRQLQIARSLGLHPDDSFLEFGCGTMRAARHFIHFLNPGKYTGIDISPEAIKYCERHADMSKEPTFLLNNGASLIPTEQKFDFILSFFVVYDMPEPLFERFLREAIEHMHKNSTFVFSWDDADAESDNCDEVNGSYQKNGKHFSFCHSVDTIDRIADEYGAVHQVYPHRVLPRNRQQISIIDFA